MATLIFRLNGVEEEEAAAVRQLLQEHQLEFYETTAGNWGVSMAGIWLQHDADADAARSLIENLQLQRSEDLRRDFDARMARGEDGLWQRARANPLRFVAFLLVAVGVLYISLKPFLNMLGGV